MVRCIIETGDDHARTDPVLLVDAANAFNSINPKVMLHNIKFICPAMAVYTYNCYSTASRLFVQGAKEISSAEGTRQGYPIAMPLYAVAIAPLLQMMPRMYVTLPLPTTCVGLVSLYNCAPGGIISSFMVRIFVTTHVLISPR